MIRRKWIVPLLAVVFRPSMACAAVGGDQGTFPLGVLITMVILLVLSLLWRWRAGRLSFTQPEQEFLKIITIKRLSPKHALVVVDFNGCRKLLGCCDGGISLLEDGDRINRVQEGIVVGRLQGRLNAVK